MSPRILARRGGWEVTGDPPKSNRDLQMVLALGVFGSLGVCGAVRLRGFEFTGLAPTILDVRGSKPSLGSSTAATTPAESAAAGKPSSAAASKHQRTPSAPNPNIDSSPLLGATQNRVSRAMCWRLLGPSQSLSQSRQAHLAGVLPREAELRRGGESAVAMSPR